VPLVTVALLAVAGLAWGLMPVSFDPGRVAWSELEYRASKLGFSTTSRVSLAAVSAKREIGTFLDTENGSGLMPTRPEMLKQTISSSFSGRNSTSELWFDPQTAVAYQAVQLTTGKRHRYRAYRFAERYVHSFLRKPERDQKTLPPARWTETRDERWPHPSWAGERLVVTSPSALFYILSTAQLEKPGDTVVLPVFSRTAVNLMRIRVEGETRQKVDFRVATPGSKSTRIRGRRNVLKITLTAQPLDKALKSDFQFLGLQGNVEILLDPQYRVPLEIKGSIPHAGRVKVKLRKIVLG